jgi:hypothetical protein
VAGYLGGREAAEDSLPERPEPRVQRITANLLQCFQGQGWIPASR